jgi:prepilin-type N-terminal cleavage/methylation domain-containing protein
MHNKPPAQHPKHTMKKCRHKGFTLIELIILVLIIGLLGAVAIAKYVSLSRETEQAAFNSVLGSLRSALNLYSAKQITSGLLIAAHNPFDDLGNKPSNYVGAFGDVDVGNCAPGQWAYQSGVPANGNWKVVVYRPKERIPAGFSWAGENWIILVVNEVKDAQNIVIGLTLGNHSSYPYQW